MAFPSRPDAGLGREPRMGHGRLERRPGLRALRRRAVHRGARLRRRQRVRRGRARGSQWAAQPSDRVQQRDLRPAARLSGGEPLGGCRARLLGHRERRGDRSGAPVGRDRDRGRPVSERGPPARGPLRGSVGDPRRPRRARRQRAGRVAHRRGRAPVGPEALSGRPGQHGDRQSELRHHRSERHRSRPPVDRVARSDSAAVPRHHQELVHQSRRCLRLGLHRESRNDQDPPLAVRHKRDGRQRRR